MARSPLLKVVLMMVLSQGAVLDAAVDWLSKGWLNLSWWQLILVTLAMTHITIVSVTVYLHRHQAHRALGLHPMASHFFRFWLWLTTGQVTREWAAIHRKHHAKCEQAEDPHSPHVYGIRKVLFDGRICTGSSRRTWRPWRAMATAPPTTGSSETSTPASPGWALA
jgi:fatty-acid desaturase